MCINVLKDDVANFNNTYYIKKSRYNSAESSQLSKSSHRLLDSLVVECWLRVQEVPGSIPSQGPRHIKDVTKMVTVVTFILALNIQKGKYWLFLKN